MGTDALLLAVSFVGFFVLVATWLLAPTDADAPSASTVTEPAPQAPAAAV